MSDNNALTHEGEAVMAKNRNPKYMRLSKGYRKYIRREKSRIRREVLDVPERERMIKELDSRFKELK